MSLLFDDADLLATLNELGGEAVIVGGVTVRGRFSQDFAEVERVESLRPIVTVRTDDVTVQHQTKVTVRSRLYGVVGIQPNGYGLTMLVLEAAS